MSNRAQITSGYFYSSVLPAGVLLSFFFVLIVGSDYWQVSDSSRAIVEPAALLLSGGGRTAWGLVLSASALCCGFLWLQFLMLRRLRVAEIVGKQSVGAWAIRGGCLGVLLCLMLLNLAVHPVWRSTDMAVFAWGLVVAQAAFTWQLHLLRFTSILDRRTIVMSLVFVLAMTSQYQPDWSRWGQVFHYNGAVRWSGLCRNPNHYGLLMALGLVLAVGAFRSAFLPSFPISVLSRGAPESVPSQQLNRVWLLALGAAILLLARGMMNSYSRGSWVAALAGVAYLLPCLKRRFGAGPHNHQRALPRRPSSAATGAWLRDHWLPILCIICAGLAVIIWSFRYSDLLILRRISSVANANDFSWRNRVAAYVGALQMAVDKTWNGTGWNQMESLYDQFYRSDNVSDSGAILLNCYFSVMVTLGIPAFLAFIAYLGTAFHNVARPHSEAAASSSAPMPQPSADEAWWWGRVCRAGSVALLVGFWFDRGLFVPGLAIPFWILLNLGYAGWLRPTAPVAERAGIRILICSKYAVAAALALTLGVSFYAAKSIDPFRRIEFDVQTTPRGELKGIALVPRIPARYPVAIYFCDSGSSVSDSGTVLRQFAEAGFAAVAVDWQRGAGKFSREMAGLGRYLANQPWAQPSGQAWIGSGAGAEAAFKAISETEVPRVLVALSGGPKRLDKASENNFNTGAAAMARSCSVVIVSSKKDSRFDADECRWLGNELRSRGVPTRVWLVPGAEHSLAEDRPVVIRFLAETCASHLPPADYAACLKEPMLPSDATRFNEWMRRAGSNRSNLWRAVAQTSSSELTALFNRLQTLGDYEWAHRSAAEFGGQGSAAPWPLIFLGGLFTAFGVARIVNRRESVRGSISWTSGQWPNIALNAAAVVCVVCALAVMSLRPIVSRMNANRKGQGLATGLLVQKQWLSDWKFLVSTSASTYRVGTLLDNVELANLQRRQFYGEIDPLLFQRFVLSDEIGAEPDREPNWRRSLWEYFHPRVRSLHDPAVAAGVLSELLRERVTEDPMGDPKADVGTAWIQRRAAPPAYQRLCAAVLRSVGIAARLDESGQAEFWTGSEWKTVPEPFLKEFEEDESR